jgi:hypothetical protein
MIDTAIAHCERGDPREPMLTGAGPMPARSIVALLGVESFVEGGIDWSVEDEMTDPGGAFYPPNSDVEMPKSEAKKFVLQEWFFPTGDAIGFEERLRSISS